MKKGKSFEYEFVKEFIENTNNKLKTDKSEYISAKEKLILVCQCGEDYKVSFTQFKLKKNKVCTECSNKIAGEKRRIPYEIVKNVIEGEDGNGCILLTPKEDYLGTSKSIDLKCKCGNSFTTSYDVFCYYSKKQCNECGYDIRANKLVLGYEHIKTEIEKLGGILITKVEEYINTSSIIKLKCACDCEFETTFQRFMSSNKRKCDNCTNFTKWNYDLVKSFVESNSECKLISTEYDGTTKDILLECKCGEEYAIKFGYFLRYEIYRTCKKCNNKFQLFFKHRDFVRDLFEQYGCTIIAASLYTGAKEPITIKHTVCGEEWNSTPDSLINKGVKGCPTCSAKLSGITSMNYKEVRRYVESFGYKVLSKSYEKAIGKLQFQCPKGHAYTTTFNHFKNAGTRCPQCHPNFKKTFDEVKEYIEDVGYKILDDNYINSDEKLHLQCPTGHDYFVRWTDFYSNGNRCVECGSYSRGESKIQDYLINKNVAYGKQHTFKDCLGDSKVALRFDFAIFNKDKKLKLLAEFDGRQHYQKSYFGNETEEEADFNLIKIQRNDQIKNAYCEQNNIPLLRIPYWEFDNIENILDKELIKYYLIKESALTT